MPNFKLTWKPDAGQPLPAGQSSHCDKLLSSNVEALKNASASVSSPCSEINGVLDLRQFAPPIDNQGQIGDCVADSTTAGLELMEIRNRLPFIKKSRLFLYYNARLQTGDEGRDDGTFIRLAYSTLTSLGTCTEATWPYDPTQVFTRPSWASYQEAYPNKTTSYYRIDATGGSALVDAIKLALQTQHPVTFGMIVDQDYMAVAQDGLIDMPKSKRAGEGGHAQLIVGYDDRLQRWIVRNSWGTDWADNGYCYVPFSYLDASGANDFWVPCLNA